MSLGTVFVSEVLGTAMLLLLGCGVVANVLLGKSKGKDGGWLLINFGWGLGVFAGVYVAYKSGAHLNPAVTLGLVANGVDEFVPGIDVTFGSTLVYLAGEFVGAFLGAVLAWAAYKDHFDDDDAAPEAKLAVFSTGPAIRNYAWNVVTEVIGTFVLVFVILCFGKTPPGSGRSRSRCSWWPSVSPSVARPDTPSTRHVTSAPASCTPCCRSRARVTVTGPTRGSRSSVPSSAAVLAGICRQYRRSSPRS